LLAALALAGLE